MKNITTNLLIILLFTPLVGCKTIEEIQRDENPIPKFKKKYMPLEGMEQKYSNETALAYCEASTSGAGHNALFNTLENSTEPQSSKKSQRPTEIRCRESLGTITCKEKQPFGMTYYNALQENERKKRAKEAEQRKVSRALLAAKIAEESAMQRCMAQIGYVVKKICVENCPSLITKNLQTKTQRNEAVHSNSPVDKNSQIFTLSQDEYLSLSNQTKNFLEKAKEGNLRAQYGLGLSFIKGEGAKENRELGINILEASAEKDHLNSQYALGTIFEKEGIYAKAARWYGRAANLGHIESQFRFGWFNWKGQERGVTKDLTKAKNWFEKAAESGHARAQFMLGAINYKNGQSLEAYKWIHISEENGLAEKYIKSSENLKNKLAKELTESQIENSKRVALACIESSYKNCNF
jgi:TPR repeat protein